MKDNLLKYKDCPMAKDHCQVCEHPEVIRMLIPRLEELEKMIESLSGTTAYLAMKSNEQKKEIDIILNNSKADGELLSMIFKRLEELEKIIDKSNLRKCRFHVDDEIDIKVF